MRSEGAGEGHLAQINVSPGGVPKRAIERAMLSVEGVAGDWQTDRRYHGGPDRAICLYSLELIRALQSEGHPIEPGYVGENLTVSGLDWARMAPGVRLRVGGALLEVVSYAAPCKIIRSSFADGRSVRISQKTNPGWSRVYARVLVAGEAQTGDVVEIARA